MNKLVIMVAAVAIAIAVIAMAPVVIDDLEHPDIDRATD